MIYPGLSIFDMGSSLYMQMMQNTYMPILAEHYVLIGGPANGRIIFQRSGLKEAKVVSSAGRVCTYRRKKGTQQLLFNSVVFIPQENFV